MSGRPGGGGGAQSAAGGGSGFRRARCRRSGLPAVPPSRSSPRWRSAARGPPSLPPTGLPTKTTLGASLWARPKSARTRRSPSPNHFDPRADMLTGGAGRGVHTR